MGILDKFKSPDRPKADFICPKCGSKEYYIKVKLIPRIKAKEGKEINDGDMIIPVNDKIIGVPEKFECSNCGYDWYNLEVTQGGELPEIKDHNFPEME